jgi:uncharacterized protein YbdZ (MbtH family)
MVATRFGAATPSNIAGEYYGAQTAIAGAIARICGTTQHNVTINLGNHSSLLISTKWRIKELSSTWSTAFDFEANNGGRKFFSVGVPGFGNYTLEVQVISSYAGGVVGTWQVPFGVALTGTCGLPAGGAPVISSTVLLPGTPIVSGTACPSGVVSLYRNGGATAMQTGIVVGSNGQWAAVTAAALVTTDTVGARVACPNGAGGFLALSAVSNIATVVGPSVAPSIDGIIYEGDSEVNGIGCPGATVWVYSEDVLLGSTQANGAGSWSLVNLGINILQAGAVITAIQQCIGSGLSAESNGVSVVVNPTDDVTQATTYLNAYLSRNPIVHNIEAADPTAFPISPVNMRGGLKYQLKIFVPETPLSQTFKLLETLEATEKPPYTEAGVTTYDGAYIEIDELLDSLLETVRPDWDQVGIKACPKMVMPFYVEGKILPSNVVVSTPVSHVLKGGISVDDFPAYRDDFFKSYIGENQKFLTQQPDGKEVVMEQPEFLYLLTNFRPAPNLLKLRYEVLYEDGSTWTFTGNTAGNISLWNVYCFGVGPKQLGFDLLPKRVLQYKVWVNEENNFRVSEIRHFVMDYRYYAHSRFVLFNNSLGGYDTVHFRGEDSEVMTARIDTGRRQLGARYESADAESFVTNNVGDREVFLQTGWFDGDGKGCLDWLQDLLLSEDVVMASDKSWVSLILKSNTLLYKKGDETLVARGFHFVHANVQPNYSRLPERMAVPARAMGWRVVSGSSYCELNEVGVRTGRKGYALLERVFTDITPNSLVRPRQTKPNDVGTAGYVAPVIDSSCNV